MKFPITKCSFCEYKTNVKCNLKRHHNAKHQNELYLFSKNEQNKEKVNPNKEKVNPNKEKVNPNKEIVNPNQLSCSKCNKIYKTQKYLKTHESKCINVDSLTCPRCMISFTKKQAKYRHIKADKCKARSIIHARTPNVQNITNNIDNSIHIGNQFIINNFGSERIDHISHADIIKILTSGSNTIPLYIEKKHFDKTFPENNNIIYTDDNKCKVFENHTWKDKDIGLLSNKLIKDNTEVLLFYCDNNHIQIFDDIKNADKYEHIKNKLFILYNKSDNGKYNDVLSKIKDLIKNTSS